MDTVAQAIRTLVENSGLTGINPVEMAIQIVATLLLIVVVKKFFWDKVTAFLESRREIVDNELTEASAQHQEASTLKQEAEQTYQKAKEDARSIVEDAKSQAEDNKRLIIKEAKNEAERMKKAAKEDLEKEIELARNKLKKEIVDVAIALSYKAIDKKITKETYNRLIDEAIAEVDKQ